MPSPKLSAKAQSIIKGKNFGLLAELNPDGSPHLTPVWVDTDGKHVLINTAIGRVKERNIRRDPRVAITVLDQANPYSWVMVRGRVAERVTGREADDHIDSLSKKYTGREKFTKQKPDEKRVIFKIEPEQVVG